MPELVVFDTFYDEDPEQEQTPVLKEKPSEARDRHLSLAWNRQGTSHIHPDPSFEIRNKRKSRAPCIKHKHRHVDDTPVPEKFIDQLC